MDDRVITEEARGRPPGGAAAAPSKFTEQADRLAAKATESRDRLGAGLTEALAQHDLDRRQLLSAQRDIVRLHRIGAMPKPTEYWQRSALPAAAVLVDAALEAIVAEGDVLGDELDHYMRAVDRVDLGPWADTAQGRVAVTAAAVEAIASLAEAIPPSRSIHALGAWWQRRLRRAAVLRALPRLTGSRSEAELIIGRTEMALLDAPPWCHGDRLLSAFELAHGDIRTQVGLVSDDLTSRVVTRGRRTLPARSRVTIELRV